MGKTKRRTKSNPSNKTIKRRPVKNKHKNNNKNKSKNKTNKSKSEFNDALPSESSLIVNNACSKSANTFKSFEKEYELSESFKHKRNVGINKELEMLFKKHKTPGNITPKTDYFTYINYLWIKEQQHQQSKYYVQVDNFRITQERVFHQIVDIAKTSKNKYVKNLYNSIFQLKQKDIEDSIKLEKSIIDKFVANDQLIELLAYINTNEIVSWGSPIFWKMMPDEMNPSINIAHITSPVMGMYEYELLEEGAKESDEAKKYRDTYKKKRIENIGILFDYCLGKSHGLVPSDVWDVEFDIFKLLQCNTVPNDSDQFYNILTAKDSLEFGFDWAKFCKALGYKTPPKRFIATSKNYLKCIMALLKTDWKTNKWKAYWYYIFLRPMSRFGNSFEKILYGFNGKFVQGQDVIFPRELSPVFALSVCFNEYITDEYTKRYKKQENVDYVSKMAEDLKIVFMRILTRNTWLSPETKKYAFLKLTHLKLIIGQPKIEYKDPTINYSSTDAWGNMRKITNWRCKKMISLEGKPVIDMPYIDWREMPFKLIGKQCYIVNAYYSPIENSIFIPLAYLQKPFIDLDERGIEYNLAHIGFTICHELSHSLDNIGSKYDYNGKLFDWWLPKDKETYAEKLKDIVAQYDVFTAYDNVHFDVHMSLSEDLADISGLAICEEYLRDFQDQHEDIAFIRKLSFHAFFCYYAIQARQTISKKAIMAQLKNNPHPLDKYRVNCTLARLKLFKSIYEIKPKDKMYWEISDTFWGESN